MSKLTSAKVKALLSAPRPAKRMTYVDGVVPAMGLRINASGVASWCVDYTGPTGRARFTIGPASGPEAVGLAEAREIALDVRARARRGEDPHHDRRAARLKAEAERQRAKAGTVQDLAVQWQESRETSSWRPVTRSQVESLLRKHVLPAIGRIDAKALTKADVRTVLEAVHRSSPITSNRVFELLRSLYNWGRSRDLVTISPCDGVKKLSKEKKRERVYSDEELRKISATVAGTDLEDLFGIVMRTGTRNHETRSMKWTDIDFDRSLWTIAAEDAKGARQHVVPLTAGVRRIIERRAAERTNSHTNSHYVFPANTKRCAVCGKDGHASPPLARTMKELSAKVGFVIRLHDVRRTVSTRMLEDLEVQPIVIEVGILGHSLPGLLGTYAPKGVGLSAVAAALNGWDAELDRILAGAKKKAATIVPIRRR